MDVHHKHAGVHGDQNRVLVPLELKLQATVSHHVGTGIQSSVLCKNNSCSDFFSNLSFCYLYVYIHMSMHHITGILVSTVPEESQILETGVADSCELPCGCW